MYLISFLQIFYASFIVFNEETEEFTQISNTKDSWTILWKYLTEEAEKVNLQKPK